MRVEFIKDEEVGAGGYTLFLGTMAEVNTLSLLLTNGKFDSNLEGEYYFEGVMFEACLVMIPHTDAFEYDKGFLA